MADENLNIALSTNEAEKNIEEIINVLQGLQKVVTEIGIRIIQAMIPLQKNLKQVEISINSITVALENISLLLQDVLDILAGENGTDWKQDALNALDIVLGVISTIATVAGVVLTAAGSTAAVIVAIIMAVVVVIVAAIMAVVEYWDEICAFFTETIPQKWEQFVEWLNTTVVPQASKIISDLWNDICDFVITGLENIRNDFWETLEWISVYVIDPLANYFAELWEGVSGSSQETSEAIKTVFNGIIEFFENAFAGDWNSAWESIKEIVAGVWERIVAKVKSEINLIIGLINGMIVSVVIGINAIIRVLNGLRFTIPDWVPGYGGNTYGLNIRYLSAPQIPYLAKGAVLPANRPFLAVVGDQRHGTNVEAPLSTIQEAVALVMDDHIAAMMAGFQALLNEQRATRQTIEGIQIGDTVIGQACDRYRSKMAVVHGGW